MKYRVIETTYQTEYFYRVQHYWSFLWFSGWSFTTPYTHRKLDDAVKEMRHFKNYPNTICEC